MFCAAATSLVSALTTLGADLLSLETALIFAVIALVAFVLATAVGRSAHLAALLQAAVTLAFVDLGFGGNSVISMLVFIDEANPAWMSKLARVGALLGIYAMTTWLFWALRRHISVVLAAGFGAALVSSVAMSIVNPQNAGLFAAKPDTGSERSERGTVHRSASPGESIWVHFIFDELISAGGLPTEIDATRELSARIRSMFLSYGFRLYEKTYSRHYLTNYSIPDTLNFEYRRTDRDPRVDVVSLSADKYFEWLRGKGYTVSVFQSDVLHFCPAPGVAVCTTFKSFDPRSPHLPYSLVTRALYLLYPSFKTFENSYISNYAVLLMGKARFPSRFDVQGFPAWFDEVAAAIRTAGNGDAIFAHFMAPHAPHLLDANCRQIRHGDIPYDLIDRYPNEAMYTEVRRSHYEAYAAQTGCLIGKIEALLATLSSSGRLGEMTFVMHGDHGSRISRSRYPEKMKPRDFVDNYATHFSIRAPNVAAGIDARSVSIQRLFAEHLREASGAQGYKEGPDSIVVETEAVGAAPRTMPMPPF